MGSGFVSYKWNGDPLLNDSVYMVTKPGTYFVEAVDIFGLKVTDTILISYPFNQLPANNFLCAGDTLKWNSNLDNTYSFAWSNGLTDSLILITTADSYWVVVTDGFGCTLKSDTIVVTVDDFASNMSLGPDISLCAGNSIGLISGADRVKSYLWSNGSTNSTIVIQNSGTYFVTVTDSVSCVATDSIDIVIQGIAPVVNFSSSPTCFGDIMQFYDSSIANGGDVLTSWRTFGDPGSGTNDTVHTQTASHQYSDTLIHQVTLFVNTLSGCSNSITKSVKVNSNPRVVFTYLNPCIGLFTQFNNQSVTNGDSISIVQWFFGDSLSGNNDTSSLLNPQHQFSGEGIYVVKLIVTTNKGCKDSTIQTVSIKPATSCFTPDDLPGLQLWLSGDKGVQLYHGSVVKWADQSGYGRDAYQNDTLKQPAFINSINKLNHKPVIRFDGIDDFLLIDSSLKVGELYVLLNWSANDTFPSSYNGIITAQTGGGEKALLIADVQGTTNLYASGALGTNIYVNSSQTLDFAPLKRYKILSGILNLQLNSTI